MRREIEPAPPGASDGGFLLFDYSRDVAIVAIHIWLNQADGGGGNRTRVRTLAVAKRPEAAISCTEHQPICESGESTLERELSKRRYFPRNRGSGQRRPWTRHGLGTTGKSLGRVAWPPRYLLPCSLRRSGLPQRWPIAESCSARRRRKAGTCAPRRSATLRSGRTAGGAVASRVSRWASATTSMASARLPAA
jgi:hypothetical protein